MQLAQAIIFAVDVERMTAFYRDVLGLAVVEGDPADGLVRLDAGGCMLALHAIPAAIAAGIELADPPVARAATPIKLAFHADDVAAARATLISAGVRMGALKSFDAVTLCDGTDPEGNVFQITNR